MRVHAEPRTHPPPRVPGLDEARPILDTLAQPVVVTDLDTKILYWNPAATDLYGFSEREALGRPIHSLLGASPGLSAVESAEALKRHGRPWTGQLDGRSRSGETLTVLVTLTPLGLENCS